MYVCFEPVNEAHTLSERDGSLILYIRYISDYYMYDSDRPSGKIWFAIYIHVTYARALHDDIPAATGDGDRARDASLPAAPTRPGGGWWSETNAIDQMLSASWPSRVTICTAQESNTEARRTRDTAASTARARLAHSRALLPIGLFAECSTLYRMLYSVKFNSR